jgi:hypothetical protein
MSDWFRQKKGFSIERLAAMVSVAEHGGIMSAAGGDPNRQSLLSRQIKELESNLNTSSTHRGGASNSTADIRISQCLGSQCGSIFQ